MTTALALPAETRGTYKIPRVRILLALLILTPFVYSRDGDPYRAFEVMFIGMLFLIVALPELLRLRWWLRAGTLSVLGLCLLILVQPAVLPLATMVYNLKFAAVLFFAFLPCLYLSNLKRRCSADEVRYVGKALKAVFHFSVLSLLFSAITGWGEVYDGGSYQRRVFAWLGDGFAPVMVFFFYYHLLAKKPVGALVAAACVVLLMQSKMAAGMAVLGCLTYLFIVGRPRTRFLVGVAAVAAAAMLPLLLAGVTERLHNFDYSLNNRLLSFNAGVEFFLSSPWLGVGANRTFSLLSASSAETALQLSESEIPFYEFFQIHNAFLRALAEMGLIGFMLLLIFCSVIVRRSWRNIRHAHLHESGQRRVVINACGLWLITFVIFHQTTGWFEPGHPQLAWLVCFLTLMNFLTAHTPHRQDGRSAGP